LDSDSDPEDSDLDSDFVHMDSDPEDSDLDWNSLDSTTTLVYRPTVVCSWHLTVVARTLIDVASMLCTTTRKCD